MAAQFVMNAQKKINFANTLRGIAALSVVVSHYLGVFWLNRPAVAGLINAPALEISQTATPIYIDLINSIPILNWGGFGVALFFLVSGFVIPFSLENKKVSAFIIGRILRIYPTYIAGFSITLLSLYHCGIYFSSDWNLQSKEILIHYIPGLRDILWSRPIDGIIWTLEIEMKFYLICILLYYWFKRKSIIVFLAPILTFLLAVYLNRKIPQLQSENLNLWKLAMVYMMASQYLIFMFIGVAFNFLFSKKTNPLSTFCISAILFTMFIAEWWLGPYAASLRVGWSYGFAVLFFLLAYNYSHFFRGNKIFNFLADISYPLYIIHGVAGYVAMRILLAKSVNTEITVLIVLSASIFAAYLLHKFIERPTQKLGSAFPMH